ncbi:hypothetical protein FS749_003756 [Ceratobasidium sp. UAMH 11750]|nr:hypothetical protein FS749_003756 [Ceratobasidium sp. UAMH 11750]
MHNEVNIDQFGHDGNYTGIFKWPGWMGNWREERTRKTKSRLVLPSFWTLREIPKNPDWNQKIHPNRQFTDYPRLGRSCTGQEMKLDRANFVRQSSESRQVDH